MLVILLATLHKPDKGLCDISHKGITVKLGMVISLDTQVSFLNVGMGEQLRKADTVFLRPASGGEVRGASAGSLSAIGSDVTSRREMGFLRCLVRAWAGPGS